MNAPILNISLLQFPGRPWDIIKHSCKDRSGVYAFINNINGKYYIGSAVCLYSRLRDYDQSWYARVNENTLIMRAIAKYGMDNFTIVILEFTTTEIARTTEQTFINTYKPEYNILTLANSSLGYKQTEEAKRKISEGLTGVPRSNKVREEMTLRQTGSSNTFFGKNHTEEAKDCIRAVALLRPESNKPGYNLTVLDTVTGVISSYKSLRSAAKALSTIHGRLAALNGKLHNNRYFITIQGKD